MNQDWFLMMMMEAKSDSLQADLLNGVMASKSTMTEKFNGFQLNSSHFQK